MQSSNAENLKNLYINKEEQMSVFTAVIQKEDTLYAAQCPELGTKPEQAPPTLCIL